MRKAPFWSYLDPFWRFRALEQKGREVRGADVGALVK